MHDELNRLLIYDTNGNKNDSHLQLCLLIVMMRPKKYRRVKNKKFYQSRRQ